MMKPTIWIGGALALLGAAMLAFFVVPYVGVPTGDGATGPASPIAARYETRAARPVIVAMLPAAQRANTPMEGA